MKKRSREDVYQEQVQLGYSRMAQHSVTICSIVRNCRQNLDRNIPVIDRLRNCFRESQVVIVENDSTDGTKDVLRQWALTDLGVHVVSEDLGVTTIPATSGNVRPWFSQHRIGLMAGYRNKYLQYLDAHGWNSGFVIIVDLDLAGISVDGIANSFGQDLRWDAVTSNSTNADSQEACYYDAYAFREYDDSRPQTETQIYTYQNLLSGLQRGLPMLKVSSAFNGLAVYRAEAIHGLRYRCEPNSDMHVEATCEHITFHLDMSRRGFDRIYINPSQWVYYQLPSSLPVRIAKVIKRLIRHALHEFRQFNLIKQI